MTEDPQSVTGRGIQSINVGTRLLMVLSRAEKPLMLRDIAAEANLTPAQAHAYLTSFKRIDLVEQDRATGRYLLGPSALRLALARLHGSEVMAAANREAKALSEKLGLMVAILVWGPHAPTVVFVHEGSETLDTNIHAGTRFSVTQSTGGRIFAAFDHREAVKKRITHELSLGDRARSSSLRAEFDKSVTKAKANGFIWLENNPVPGVSSVAAPVFNEDGDLELVAMLIGTNKKLPGKVDGTPISQLIKLIHSLMDRGQSGITESKRRGAVA